MWRNAVPYLISILVAFLSAVQISTAQKAVSVGVGGNYYQGELAHVSSSAQLNSTIQYNYWFDDRLYLRGALNMGFIEGHYEPGDQIRDIHEHPEATQFFTGSIRSIDVSLNLEFIQWNLFYAYGGVGFGYLDYSIYDQQDRSLVDRPSTRLENENYETRAVLVPLNVGIVFFAEKQVNIILEQAWHFTNTDYLDNIGLLGNAGNDSITRRMLLVRYKL